MEVNGKLYRKCVAWRASAGNGYACHEMCCDAQRQACSDQQETDSRHCDSCDAILVTPVKKTFTTVTVDRPGFKWTTVETKTFCSGACADTYKVLKS